MKFECRNGRGLAFATIFLLSACGGGSGDNDDGGEPPESPSAGLFADYADSQAGGYRSIDADITDEAFSGDGPGCGYAEIPTVGEAKTAITGGGGTVTTETENKFCGSSSEETSCLVRVGGSLVVDTLTEGSPDTREIELIVPGLGAGRRAYFYIASQGSNGIGEASIETPDTSIPASGDCTNVMTTQLASAINGSWTGYVVTYNAASKTGNEAVSNMTCTDQSCVISGSAAGPLPFSTFKSTGVWRATVDGFAAGAAMSPNSTSLAVYVCSTPLANSSVLSQCLLYGYRRV